MGAGRFGLVEQFTELEWNALTSTAKPNAQGWTTAEMCNFLTHGYGYRATEWLQSRAIYRATVCFMPLFFVTPMGNTCSLKPQASYFYWGGEIPQGLVKVKLSVPNYPSWWSTSTESLSASPCATYDKILKPGNHWSCWRNMKEKLTVQACGHRIPKAQMLISWYTDHIHFDLDCVQKYYNVF